MVDSSESRRIFAMGGAEFSLRPENRLLHDYILSIPRRERPRICLLPTASGDPKDQIARFHETFDGRRCEASHVSLFRLGTEPAALRERLLGQDIIYVGGGSMLNLLAIWDAHGIDSVLREAWQRGIVLCGLSAGSMCWFEWGVTKAFGPPQVAAGLGFLPGSNCVHYHEEPERRPFYLRAVKEGLPAGYGVDDHVGLLFVGTELARVVAGGPRGRAYRVELSGGQVTESGLEVVRLEGEPASAAEDVAEFRRLRVSRRLGGPRRQGRL